MNLKQFTEKHKILTPLIFWGFWVLLVIFLMAMRDTQPDFNANDDYDPRTEYCGPGGTPC